MPTNTIIFQAMDDDYIEDIPPEDLLTTVRQAKQHMDANGVYYGTVFLDKVSSDAPTA
jgi:hypothetical protein